jgi:adenosine deaminase
VLASCVVSENTKLQNLHPINLDDTTFTLRFQSSISRRVEPILFFQNLVAAFEIANKNRLVTGVNILGPEHEEVAMRDYWLHMQMFNYCHNKYPEVKYSLHAGELTLGFVKPEDLTWHINSAVYDAKANRIGHGVDLPYEQDCYSLLNYMSQNHIAVEINLSSNEFILNVKEDRHPVLLYKNSGVPIVIATDDAGILRTNLTEQFVLLANRYKEITYSDIKQFVYNSIEYSFIKELELKKRLKSQLNHQFKIFENQIIDLDKN